MAKFCGNCGAKQEDDARVCGQCGTPFEGVPAAPSVPAQAPDIKIVDPEKTKKMMKTVKLAAVGVVALIVVIVGLNIGLSFVGKKGLVRTVMKAYDKYDIDTLVDHASDMYYYAASETFVDTYFENAIGYNIDNFELSVGHNYKLSYEIDEIYEMSDRKQDEEFKNIVRSYPDFDAEASISKIAVASVKLTAKQGSKSVTRSVEITMSKESGEWKILYIQ